MKLELKNVKFYESMSEETNCFQADLFINGKKIAYVKNDGRGGSTDYNVHDFKDQPVLREAEAYCKTLPKERIGNTDYEVSLEGKIDDLFEDWLKVKADKKLLKDMEKGILIGTRNQYQMLYWKHPIITLLSVEKGREVIRKTLKDYIDKGETILNTNIPKELYPISK